MHRSVGLGLLLALVVVLTPACNRSDATPPSPTVRRETSTTSTTTLEQSYAIPEVIDAEYVNRVLAALYHVAGDVLRTVHTTGELAQEDLVPLRAIFNDPEFEIQAQGFARLVADDPAERHEPPGDPVVRVATLVRADPVCVYAKVTVDLSEILRVPPQPRTTFLELHPTQPGADRSGLNPTPWSVADEDPDEERKCV